MRGWLTRLYERLGARYVWLCPVGFVFAYVLLVVVWLGAFAVARFEGLSAAEFGAVLLMLEGAAFIALCGGFYFSRDDVRLLLGWAAGARDPAAAERTMRAAHRFPRRTAGAAVLTWLVTGLPAAVVSLPIAAGRLGLADVLFISLAGLLVGLYVGTLGWSIMEATLWPLVADIVAYAPSANRVQGRPAPLSFRMIASVALVGAVGGILLGSLVLKFGSGASEGLRVIGFSCLVALTLVLLRIVMITWSVLQPIRELSDAARTVAGGDLDVLVHVTSPDELGELAASFNDMVDGLRERESLRQRIVKVADDERRRLERDLHDGAQQNLVLLKLKLGLIERQAKDDPQLAALVSETSDDLSRALGELRDLAHGIYPAVLESEGLFGALRDCAQRAAITTELDCDGARRYPPEVEAAVYFCCLEALQNAAKHAGEHARATLMLHHRDGTLLFEIADSGRGFDAPTTDSGVGLQNMTDRIGALGGTLTIHSAPGHGTKITGTLPIPG